MTSKSEIALQIRPSPQQSGQVSVTSASDKQRQKQARRGSKFEANHRNIRRSHKSSDYILSVLSLSQWIQTYGARSDQDLEDEGETFVDTHGVRRYVSNWKAVPELRQLDQHDPTFRRLHHNLTGCIQHSIHCVTEASDADIESGKVSGLSSAVVKASFLNDWQRLWYFLEDDDEDELAQQTPLFRLAIEFIFHRRTYQIFFAFTIYNMVNDAVLYHFFPYAGYEAITALYAFDALVHLFTYIVAYRLFRGQYPKLFNHKHNRHARDREVKKEEEAKEVRHKLPGKGSYSRLHWTSALRQLMERSIKEMFLAYEDLYTNAVAYDDVAMMKQRGIRRPLTYYDLLNISLKFFTRHNGTNVAEIRWNRTEYRLMILFVVFLYPLYVIIYKEVVPYLFYILKSCKKDYHGNFCQYYLYRVITTGGAITPLFTNIVFGASILISLVGLAYGGEIANRLADTWMEKFCCLRRLPMSDSEDDCFIVKAVAEEEVSKGDVALKEDSNYSDSNQMLNTTTSALHQRVGNSYANTNKDSSNKLDGAESSKKFRLDDALTAEEKAASKELIGNLISRDATEHYLFIREMMQAADRIWSPVLTVLFVLSAYVCLSYFLYIILVIKSTGRSLFAQLLVIILVRILFLFIYPIVSLSHANSYIYKLQNCFKVASPDDYEIIGGRDRWVSFMIDTPAVWTYYGIWITWDRLFGILWTVLAAAGAYTFTLITSGTS